MQSLSFSLKSPVRHYLRRLLDYMKDDSILQATVDLLVYGGILDPDPRERPTAKELGQQLGSTGTRLLEDQTIFRKPPVWTRHWIHYYSDTPTLLSEKPALAYPETSCHQACLTSSSQMALESATDANTEPLLDDSDSEVEYDWEEDLILKQQCPYCPLIGRPIALKYHVRVQHRNRPIHKCPSCGYLFANSKQLNRHQLGLDPAYTCTNALNLSAGDYFTIGQQISSTSVTSPDGGGLARTDSGMSSGGPEDYPFSRTSTNKSGPGEYPTQMRSGGVTRYHPDDDLSGGPCVKQ